MFIIYPHLTKKIKIFQNIFLMGLLNQLTTGQFIAVFHSKNTAKSDTWIFTNYPWII